MLRDATSRFVGLSVGWSVSRLVGQSPSYFFGVFELFEHWAPAKKGLGKEKEKEREKKRKKKKI